MLGLQTLVVVSSEHPTLRTDPKSKHPMLITRGTFASAPCHALVWSANTMLIAQRSSYWTVLRRSVCPSSRRPYRAAAVRTFPSPSRAAQRGHQRLQLRASYSNGKPFDRSKWTEEGEIKSRLEENKWDKYGFVIYRTTYTPETDDLWPRFQQRLWDRARHSIGGSKHPELIDNLVYTFVDDARLDGATVATLRTVFDLWRRSPEAQAEQPRAQSPVFNGEWMPGTPGTRYNYCIRASEEVMRSVVIDAPAPPEPDIWMEGSVDFTDANWKSAWIDYSFSKETFDSSEEICEAIEGCQEQNVGWMRLAHDMLPIYAYEYFSDGSDNDVWFWLYQRPPDVAFR